MKIMFELDEHESDVTPMMVASALIDAVGASKTFPDNGLKEVLAYLSVYTRYAAERKNNSETTTITKRYR